MEYIHLNATKTCTSFIKIVTLGKLMYNRLRHNINLNKI